MNKDIDWNLLGQYLGRDISDDDIQLIKQKAVEDKSFGQLLDELSEIWEASSSLGEKLKIKLDEKELKQRLHIVKEKITEIESEDARISMYLSGELSENDVDDIIGGEKLQPSQEIWLLSSGLTKKQNIKVSESELGDAMAKMKARIRQTEEVDTSTKFTVDKATTETVQAKTVSDTKSIKTRFQWQKMSSIAAAVVLVMLAGVFMLKNQGEIQTTNAIAEHTTKRVVLGDGTEVWLEKGSSLSYPEAFATNKREVSLKGIAFFEVAKNPDKPFIIHTQDSKTEVLGTSFRISEQSDATELAVVTGKVAFSSTDGKDKMVLVANQVAMLNEGVLKKIDRSTKNVASLMQAEMEFKGNTLAEVAKTIGKAYDKDISIASEELKNRRFTGVIKNKSFDKAIRQIADVIGADIFLVSDQAVRLQ